MPPTPKSAATRQRRNKSTTAAVLPPTEPFTVPELPVGYDKRTLRWWDSVKRSPMKGEYTEADWEGLLAVAACLNTWWFAGDTKALAEFRMQAREYGLTPMARRSLQWEIARGEEAERRRSQTRAPQPTSDPRLRVIVNGTPDAADQAAVAHPRAGRRAVH